MLRVSHCKVPKLILLGGQKIILGVTTSDKIIWSIGVIIIRCAPSSQLSKEGEYMNQGRKRAELLFS